MILLPSPIFNAISPRFGTNLSCLSNVLSEKSGRIYLNEFLSEKRAFADLALDYITIKQFITIRDSWAVPGWFWMKLKA